MKCKACKREIIFGKTKSGKDIPIDATSLSEDDIKIIANRRIINFRYGEHIAHFATCTDSDKFRKTQNDTEEKQKRAEQHNFNRNQ